MSLDPAPSDAELLAMLAQKQGQSRRPFIIEREPMGESTAYHVTGHKLVPAPGSLMAGPHIFDVVPVVQPVSLRIPWSCLISDNAMYLTREGKRFKTPEYRETQKRIRALATDAMDGRPLADCPLVITFRFYVPNTHRRDVHNFIAGLADSLKGVVFTDDHWLHQGGWTHAGRDVDAPRCELTITPL